MRYIAAYALAVLGGNEAPSAADITKIMSAVGIDCDAAEAKKVIDALKGKKLDDVIAAGSKKLASVPSGGGGGAAGPAAAGPAAAAKEEKKKPEPVEESEEEGDMGFGLFD
jgi:large subunit ribosomal protein LP2